MVEKMKSVRKEPPRIVLATHDDGSIQGIITPDTVNVDCPTGTVFDYVLYLFTAYYAWGLNFPRVYHLLSFLQVHVLHNEVESSAFRGVALVKLEKALHL